DAAGAPAGAPAVDLTGRLGRCSGALGVLQCAAAVAHFDRRAEDGATDGTVLAWAGSAGDDAAAALLLTAP
ncbi:beta-ketoacyl synthase, partial [Streptomyces sp. KLMMK]